MSSSPGLNHEGQLGDLGPATLTHPSSPHRVIVVRKGKCVGRVLHLELVECNSL